MDTRYLDALMRSKHGAALVASGFYPNAKEFTESSGAFYAISRELIGRRLGHLLGDRSVVALCPGDGRHPRTALMIALNTVWRAVSIDPVAKLRDTRCSRVTAFAEDAEDFDLYPYHGASLTVIASVHSHARLKPLWDRVKGPRIAVAIPCCVPQEVGREPDVEYEDEAIISPERTVRIWVEMDRP